jgi:heat shock protein HspQ
VIDMDFARAIPTDVQLTPPGLSGLSPTAKSRATMPERTAKFGIGQVVRHRRYPFRGVIFDIDPTFANTEEWWLSIPEEVRPKKDQPFYHLLAENSETEYVAYVSEQNLVPDNSGEPVRHPQIKEVFVRGKDGSYRMRPERQH